ncbi:14.7 kDa heat shock protein [Bienertia sinuspersici]
MARWKLVTNNDVYYFFLHNPRDWESLVGYHNTLNFKGGILLLQPSSYTMSYKSINFSEIVLWVKVEGIPFILSNKEFGIKIFGIAGGVLEIDKDFYQDPNNTCVLESGPSFGSHCS